MKDKHIRLSSEQYIIDENNCITIPYSVLYNAGLGGVPEFNIVEKNAYEYVYSVIPSTETKEGWEFVQKVNCSEETGIKIDVTNMFELKPGDSVSVDVYEFELFLFDRVSVLKTNREKEEDEEFDSQLSKLTDECYNKIFDKLDKFLKGSDSDTFTNKDWTAELNRLKKEQNKREKGILKKDKTNAGKMENLFEMTNKKPLKEDILDSMMNDDEDVNLDDLNKAFSSMLGNLIKEIAEDSTKKLHSSKDPLLNEFIDDMLARVYGRDGAKVIMIHTNELEQFVDDMTYWYNRIKKGK